MLALKLLVHEHETLQEDCTKEELYFLLFINTLPHKNILLG